MAEEAKDERWPRALWACLLVLVLEAFLVAVALPKTMIQGQLQRELDWAVSIYGVQESNKLVKSTNEAYSTVFIESGLNDKVHDVFFPKAAPTTFVDRFAKKATEPWFDWLSNRVGALKTMVYLATYRVVSYLYWFPYFVAMGLPSIFAGFMQWQIKKYNFDYSSPFFNHYGHQIITWSPLLVILSVLVPVSIPPMLICMLIVVLLPIAFMWIISNLPKRI
ncbi:DUF4400 domain-containing protein [Pseudomonas sp. R5(2019)]|uniref:DUF4400 domain-containing protein n=1 Tax=Pseudomonas sp. R5(2019) TaxID=2697566 RepID=UPI0014130E85|nr:DUF4400 domain-containing protein [Pseudomonas sp. R5(2019)]NBA95290.1 DUF4400 domain-containing protein [Pseudomonas sp. R5(2019)]